MIFTSLQFLAFYTILLVLLFAIRGTQGRQHLLLLASYVFYGAWNPFFVVLILLSSLWGWGLGLLMNAAPSRAVKKRYLWLSVILSLGMLAYFKYANFFADSVASLFGREWQNADIILPVGISFFTFQTMSYTIDLYRERIPVCKSLPKFMLFVAFFPQLVAGPIVRASEFLPQLDRHIRLKAKDFIVGAQIFLGGAIQKVLFADNLSTFVDPVFAQPELYSGGTLWLGALAYSVQIFCDFSGYSLMAIGVARTLGFTLPKNFNMPYLSKSITEFWRRWHLTLSFWLRDYLYISLGGNRRGALHTQLNLMITMLLGGLWHGASWNFVIWGALHGAGLVVHKHWLGMTERFTQIRSSFPYKTLMSVVTLLFVLFLWIPFRAPDFSTTRTFISGMFSVDGVQWYSPQVILVMTAAVLWHVMHAFKTRWLFRFPDAQPTTFGSLLTLGTLLLLIVLFAPVNTSPFIYFQF